MQLCVARGAHVFRGGHGRGGFFGQQSPKERHLDAVMEGGAVFHFIDANP